MKWGRVSWRVAWVDEQRGVCRGVCLGDGELKRGVDGEKMADMKPKQRTCPGDSLMLFMTARVLSDLSIYLASWQKPVAVENRRVLIEEEEDQTAVAQVRYLKLKQLSTRV